VASYAASSGPVPSTLASHTGRTLAALRDFTAAERHCRRALVDRTPDACRLKRGLTLANLGGSVAAQRRHEEAVELWDRALGLMDGAVSGRNREGIKAIRYRERGVPGAGSLVQHATDLLRRRA